MARRTKKAGPIARFGPRYGVRIRRRALDIEVVQRQPHTCPRCQAPKVQRAASGVWRCRRCGLVFAGGAYRPIVTTAVRREIVSEVAAPAPETVGGKAKEEAG